MPGEPDGRVHFDLNCDEIRARIFAYVESREMRVPEFQHELGINNTLYHRFMKLRGPKKGIENQTMKAAYPFFKKFELAGIKIPEEQVVSLADREKDRWNVSSIHLGGEEDERVPVYETYADIRRKIKAHLSEAPTTKAEFLREVCKAFPSDPNKTIKQSQMEDFLAYKGATRGNASAVFYGAYVYFEKLRIKNGEEKSKKRLEMEDIYRVQGGVSRERVRARHWAADDNMLPMEDEYGRVMTLRYWDFDTMSWVWVPATEGGGA